MPTVKLTKRRLDSIPPQPTEFFLWDTEVAGFGVRIHPSGQRTFVFKCRPGGGRAATQRKITIGKYGSLTVDQARTEAQRLAGEVATGRDPGAQRNNIRQASRAIREAATVEETGKDYLKDVELKKKRTTSKEYARLWARHVLPALGKMRVAEVTPSQVAKLHASLGATPYVANRVLALVGTFFTYAKFHDPSIKENPAHGIEFYPEQSKERYLTAEELTRLGEALARAETTGLPPAPRGKRPRKLGATAKHRPKSADEPQPANPYAVGAIRFLLLSGWREGEALSLRWTDVDANRSIVLDDTKTGKSARTLGQAARLFLSGLPRIEGSPFVFPGRALDKPLQEIKRVWYAVRHAAGLDDVRLHDLRHTHASVAVSRGHSLPIIGKLLGHTETKTTQKYAHLGDDPVQTAANDVTEEIAALLGLAVQDEPNESENDSTSIDEVLVTA